MYPSEYIVFCEADSVSFIGSGLPDWDAFCADGNGGAICDFATGDLWCLEPLRELTDSLICNELWRDSLEILNLIAGTVLIEDRDYAYFMIEGESPLGLIEEEVLFYGCAGVNFERCHLDSDTTVCDRGVLDVISFSELTLESLWDCSVSFSGCSSTTIDSDNRSVDIYPNPVRDRLYLMSEEYKILDYEVLDIYGKTVKSSINYSSVNRYIEVDDLNSGIYFIRMYLENGEAYSLSFVKT